MTRRMIERRSRPAVVAVLAAAVLVWLCAVSGAPTQQFGNPGVLLKVGTTFGIAADVPAGVPVVPGSGYDGQFTYLQATDPFLRDPQVRDRFDSTRYRASRIVLPLAAWTLSGGGDREALVWVIPLINVLAIAGATWLIAVMLARRRRSPWWALLFPLAFGVVAGVVNDVHDPLAAALLVAGLALWSTDRTRAALVLLLLACLARETAAIPVGVVVAIELGRFRLRAWPWLVVPVVLLVWRAYLRTIPVRPGLDAEPQTPDLVPFRGMVAALDRVLVRDVVGAANWELFAVLFLVGLAVATAGVAVRTGLRAARERAWPSRASLLPLPLAASLVLIPFLSEALWGNPLSYARYAAAASGLLVVQYASSGRRAWALAALPLTVLTLFNPFVPLLPTQYGAVLYPPQATPSEIAPTDDEFVAPLEGPELVDP